MAKHALQSLVVGACLVVTTLAASGCGDDDPGPVADTSVDTRVSDDDVDDDDSSEPDVSDTSAEDALVDAVTAPPRAWNHRVIGGMSMGTAAATIALRRPGDFDVVGALGGYVNWRYMVHMMRRLHFGGFCDLATLEALPGDMLNSDDALCGTGPVADPLEFPQSFDRYHFDTNGINMERNFYDDVFEDASAALGNLAVPAHPLTPLLPAGVDFDWWASDGGHVSECRDGLPAVPARWSFNAEYNPVGAHPVIPVCDIARPMTDGFLPSWFDANTPPSRLVDPFLAVDINQNGVRDRGEPLVLNGWERYEDVGTDGCSDEREDGAGGCEDASADASSDPNGDNYHWRDNPNGLERNERFDAGEPYADLGLDGVSETVSGFADAGEGNGQWDATEGFSRVLSVDVVELIRAAPRDDLERIDFWFDAGIRDALHAAVATRNLVGALLGRGIDVSLYKGFTDRPGTLFPELDETQLVSNLPSLDMSAEAIGKNVYIEYGNPDATDSEIAKGDGKHVGSDVTVVNRIASFLAAAVSRLPRPDLTPGFKLSAGFESSYYSEGLGSRRSFTIALPPGYNHEDNAESRYPVLYMMHGLGQTAFDLAPAALATSIMMQQGNLAKAIVVFPDGACCFRDSDTGLRECACSEADAGMRACVDPTCTGPHDTCEVREIPSARLNRECNRGSLFLNLQSDKWGNTDQPMGYEDSVFDLIEVIDATYRTRLPSVE